jgi:hypothetical protein
VRIFWDTIASPHHTAIANGLIMIAHTIIDRRTVRYAPIRSTVLRHRGVCARHLDCIATLTTYHGLPGSGGSSLPPVRGGAFARRISFACRASDRTRLLASRFVDLFAAAAARIALRQKQPASAR